MSELFGVVPAATLLPDGVAPLAGHADQEGVRIVATVLERWEDESEPYRGRGEAILAAVVGDEVVGIGALLHCPQIYGALRMRRFYVAPAWRRHGVAHSLAGDSSRPGMGTPISSPAMRGYRTA